MKIKKIDSNTIKIILSANDMLDLNLTYNQIDKNDTPTKSIILKLVDIAKIQEKINIDYSKLYIEAFPYDNGGCILYVNMIDSSSKDSDHENTSNTYSVSSFNTPLVFEFEDIDCVTGACCFLLKNLNHLIIKSSLYLYEKKYTMLVYTYCKMEDKIINFLSEYCVYIGQGAILSCFIKEHGNVIILDNCVEIVNKYLE